MSGETRPVYETAFSLSVSLSVSQSFVASPSQANAMSTLRSALHQTRPGEAGAFRLVGRTTLRWRPWMGWVDGPR